VTQQNYNRRKPRNFDFNPGVRLQNPETQKLLHLSGEGETIDPAYSWRGYRTQAETLKQRAETRGEGWPYIEVTP